MTDGLIPIGEFEAAGDLTTAANIRDPQSQSQAAVVEVIQPAIAALPGVEEAASIAAAAAVDAEVAARDLVERGPGIPFVDPDNEEYLAITISPSRRVMSIIHADASVEAPVSRTGGAVTFVDPDQTEIIKGTVTPSGRIGQDALDSSGRTLTATLREYEQRMGWGAVPGDARPIDVLGVGGQSNSIQTDTSPAGSGEYADPDLLWWNPANAAVEVLPASSMGLAASVGREYRRRFPMRRVLLVEGGQGATGFRSTSLSPAPAGYRTRAGGTWDRRFTAHTGQVDPANLYDRFIGRMLAARTAALTITGLVEFTGVFMSLGEDDMNNQDNGDPRLTEAEFAAFQDDLMGAVRADLGVAGLPFVWGSLLPEHVADHAASANVRAALTDTPRRVTGTAYVWGPANLQRWNDGRIHWSAQGQKARGPLMLDGLYRARMNQSGMAPLPPQNLRVTRSGTAYTVAFEAPPTRATAFEVAVSVDEAASWTVLPLTGPIWTETAGTAPTATTPVWVRARTTNDVGVSDYCVRVRA